MKNSKAKLFGQVSVSLAIVAGLFGGLSSPAHASCGIWSFGWDMADTDLVATANIVSSEKYGTVSYKDMIEEGETINEDVYKSKIKIEKIWKQSIGTNLSSGNIVEVYEVLDERTHEYGGYDTQVKMFVGKLDDYNRIGDRVLVKLDIKDPNQKTFTPNQDGACDSSYMNFDSGRRIMEKHNPDKKADFDANVAEINYFNTNLKIREVGDSKFQKYMTANFLAGIDFGYKDPKPGIVTYFPEFFDKQNATRAEFVTMLGRAFDIPVDENATQSGFVDVSMTSTIESKYKDDNGNSHWYPLETNAYIAKFKQLGLIHGYDDKTFRPNSEITRQEAAKILVRVMAYRQTYDTAKTYKHSFPDVDKSNKFNPEIAVLNTIEVNIDGQTEKIMKGYEDGTFRPTQNITRGEISKIVYAGSKTRTVSN